MVVAKKKLTQAECDAMLRDNIIGTLYLSEDGCPYAIQFEYLYRDGAFYMGTYLTGRKIDCLEKNNRAVFTVFTDRHSHPEMIKLGIRCHSVMAEGRVETLCIKEARTREGGTSSFRLMKFTVEEMGSWRCTRKVCSQASGADARAILSQWIDELEPKH